MEFRASCVDMRKSNPRPELAKIVLEAIPTYIAFDNKKEIGRVVGRERNLPTLLTQWCGLK